MNRLSRKLLLSVSLVIICVTIFSLFLNSRLIEPLYIYRMKAELLDVCDELMLDTVSLDSYIESVEGETAVVIVKVPNTDDNDAINESLRNAFVDKGVGLKNHWLWVEDYKSAVKNGSQLRIYSQGKLNYSVMINYLPRGNDFIAAAMVIPNISQTVSLVNLLTVGLFGGAVVLLMVMLYLMSLKLSASQAVLQDKNEQMQLLLSHVSHDLKTPISLIKAYTSAIKDGMDDGTFLDTIIKQNGVMESMTERLLELCRWQQTGETAALNLSSRLQSAVDANKLLFEQSSLTLTAEVEEGIEITANAGAVESVIDNLLGNALKYSTGQTVSVSLRREGTGALLTVSNEAANADRLDAGQIWEPFYVGEESRNKALSGSGLGLSIVRTVAQTYGYRYDCDTSGGSFTVTVLFC